MSHAYKGAKIVIAWLISQLFNILVLALLLPIFLYRYAISPLIGPRCRYQPTCSNYAIQALREYGPFVGLWLTIKRLLQCHPWGGSGYDPVPQKKKEAKDLLP